MKYRFSKAKDNLFKNAINFVWGGFCASERTPTTTGSPARPQSNQNVWVLPPISCNVDELARAVMIAQFFFIAFNNFWTIPCILSISGPDRCWIEPCTPQLSSRLSHQPATDFGSRPTSSSLNAHTTPRSLYTSITRGNVLLTCRCSSSL